MPVQGQTFDPISILQFPKPGQSEPILANPMPILANPMPISGQSVTSYVLNLGTSPLCGLVSSLIGGRIQDNRAFPILTNPLKCWPIHANPGQSGANP